MKILITHVYSQYNRGDAAILNVLYNELKNIYPNSKIIISTMEKTKKLEFIKGAKIVSSFFYLSVYKSKGVFRILNTGYVVLSTFLYLIVQKKFKIKPKFLLTGDLKRLIKIYESTDLIIAVGGGYLNGKKTIKSTISLLLQSHSLYLGKALDKRVILYSQSIGPFSTSLQRIIAKFILNKVDFIFARENISVKTLKSLDINSAKYRRSADAAFLFKGEPKEKGLLYLKESGVNLNKKKLGITARKWLDPISQGKYETELCNFIDSVTEDRKILVLLIPQVSSKEHNDDDSTVNARIFDNVKNKDSVIKIDSKYDHNQIKSIYANLDCLVGTRMHSCIFTLSSFVPVIAIEYEYKTRGIMNDLGLGSWVVKIEHVTARQLLKKFKKLSTNRRKYIQILRRNITKSIDLAKLPTILLKNYA